MSRGRLYREAAPGMKHVGWALARAYRGRHVKMSMPAEAFLMRHSSADCQMFFGLNSHKLTWALAPHRPIEKTDAVL